jgi:excisionase family DNA binding protein
METGNLIQTPGIFLREFQILENQLLNYKQAAKYLSVSESYLRKLKARGLVPHVFVGNRGVRFRVSSLNSWVSKREVT